MWPYRSDLYFNILLKLMCDSETVFALVMWKRNQTNLSNSHCWSKSWLYLTKMNYACYSYHFQHAIPMIRFWKLIFFFWTPGICSRSPTGNTLSQLKMQKCGTLLQVNINYSCINILWTYVQFHIYLIIIKIYYQI